ncbi:MAG: glycosyltransferase family 2 protein [bacterium]
MPREPLVSIIIPHHHGEEILTNCLESLEKTTYANKEVLLVDNGSTDGSVSSAQARFPWIRVVQNAENLGYAGGCNAGIAQARGTYFLFLNNDTEFEPDWLSLLVTCCERDAQIAACQPKILSLKDKRLFDYAGAAGGLLDRFGYPFARGRLFFRVEKDEGQYEEGGDIFWASGTAMLVRKSALDEVGYFDDDFFAHMEEIDLCWRFHLTGYRVVVMPPAVVYHQAGSTLKPDSPLKIYLNHRNSLIMLLKNYQRSSLFWIFPGRLLLELMTLLYSGVKFDFVRVKAVCKALIYVAFSFFRIMTKRSQVQRLRKVADSDISKKMYRGSVAVDYFLRGVRRTQDLRLKACK